MGSLDSLKVVGFYHSMRCVGCRREPEDIVNQDGELWKGDERMQENDEFSFESEIRWELYCGISWWRRSEVV